MNRGPGNAGVVDEATTLQLATIRAYGSTTEPPGPDPDDVNGM